MAKRLTEHHPLTKKREALETFMREHKISIEFDGYHMIVKDDETGVWAYGKDNESGETLTELPYPFETKLILPE